MPSCPRATALTGDDLHPRRSPSMSSLSLVDPPASIVLPTGPTRAGCPGRGRSALDPTIRDRHGCAGGAVVSVHEERIRKPGRGRLHPNLVDYEATCRAFDWDTARAPARRTAGRRRSEHRTRGGRAACTWTAWRPCGHPLARPRTVRVRDLTYRELDALTNRFANTLHALGVQPRRTGVHAAGTRAGAACNGARRAQGGRRGVAAVLRVRPRADQAATPPRRRTRARHDRRRCIGAKSSPSAPKYPVSRTCCWSAATSSTHGCGTRPTSSRSVRLDPSSSRCCTSRAAPPGPRRVRCTCTTRSSRTTQPRASPSTCIPTTSSGAPPIPDG